MLGMAKHEIILVPHNNSWKQVYKNARNEIKQILGANVISIHHIGSTAINGIVAKPIIDIGVIIKRIEWLNIAGMESAGYVYYGNSNSFVPEDYYFNKFKDEHKNIETHHIHCYTEDNCENLKNNILFCEYLNSHPEIAKHYEELKINLAYTYLKDRISYCNGKTDFCNNVVLMAKEREITIHL